MSPKTKPKRRMADGELRMISPEKLDFDSENPRLFHLQIKGLDETSLINLLWKEMNIEELALSMVAEGYFDHEPMLAIGSKISGRFVVIEGNRRLAAVKLLLNYDLQQTLDIELPTPSGDVLDDLREIPVVITGRKEAWQYIGFKHVNGPKPWDAVAKAEYIARVHNNFNVPLDDIPMLIGDTNQTVRRLYRGLMVLRQAQSQGIYDTEDRTNKRLFFSHLYTGLGYPGIQNWLGIKEQSSYKENPIRGAKHKNHLRDLCIWLFGSKENDIRPLIRSQNPDLKQLDEALQSERGRDALQAGLPLNTAYDASIGDERRFREALIQSKVSLEQAVGKVFTGFDVKTDQLLTARQILSLADSLTETMEGLASKARSKRS